MEESQRPGSDAYEALPAEHVTIDQVVAWNMRHWRRAAGMTQEELGDRMGWSAANISAAERSVSDGRDRRRFDATTVTAIAAALGMPLSALFLPPEEDGTGKRYVFHLRDQDSQCFSMADLMTLVMPDNDDDSDSMGLYRYRFEGAVTAYIDKDWAEEVASWFRKIDSAEKRADRAQRLRSRQAQLLEVAAELAGLAEALEGDGS